MAVSTLVAAAGGKTMYRTTLTSGTSYTVPAGVTYLNVTLVGGGGGGNSNTYNGLGGAIRSSTLSCTPGASITYAIGAGGGAGAAGGNTTFTGATTATGGNGNDFNSAGKPTAGLSSNNWGQGTNNGAPANNGAAGSVEIEYWV